MADLFTTALIGLASGLGSAVGSWIAQRTLIEKLEARLTRMSGKANNKKRAK